MKIVLIRYNAGNYRSVLHALERLGVTGEVSSDPAVIQAADKVIFPGVGEASSTMRCLAELGLEKIIPELRQPVLGICLGLQLMCAHTEENDTKCLGIFPLRVKKLPHQEYPSTIKVPHMGWNTISELHGPLFTDIPPESYVYFVHSYAATLETSEQEGKAGQNSHTIAVTTHGEPFASAIQKDNFYAVQFHPEKSGEIGAKILSNFLSLLIS